MVGTAQVDDFAVFIKKVGYSVGVEALLQRATDFGERYGSVPSFREADWVWLVQERWRLKSANVGDVFGALGIARIHNHEVFPGPIGESLGVARQLLSGETFDQACRLLVGLAVVAADGDVFLNALRSKFERKATAKALVSMVRQKRDALFQCFQSARDREAVASAVSIERQRSNKGGRSSGGLAAMAKGSPLRERAQGLGLSKPIDVTFVEAPSEDYLHKITVSRKGWAESLDLFCGEDLTDAGVDFLSLLSKSGYSCEGGPYCVWPTTFEVEAKRFDARGLERLNLPSTWQFQSAVFRAMSGHLAEPVPGSWWIEDAAQVIARIYHAYRGLSQHRSMIRNEVPSYVAIAVSLARAFATQSRSHNVEAVLHSPLLESRGITVRKSKTIEFAITVR